MSRSGTRYCAELQLSPTTQIQAREGRGSAAAYLHMSTSPTGRSLPAANRSESSKVRLTGGAKTPPGGCRAKLVPRQSAHVQMEIRSRLHPQGWSRRNPILKAFRRRPTANRISLLRPGIHQAAKANLHRSHRASGSGPRHFTCGLGSGSISQRRVRASTVSAPICLTNAALIASLCRSHRSGS